MIGVLAQRLVRVLCKQCRQQVPAPPEVREVGLEPGVAIWAPAGCDACRGTGYSGRTGIFELVLVDEVVRSQVLAKQAASEIKQSAVERGLCTLLGDGKRKLLEGSTSLQEVLRVCERDEI